MIKRLKTLIILTSIFTQSTLIAEVSRVVDKDPHYNQIGFFDIHLCNWPERPNFFKVLFSSEKYKQIDSMNIYTPDEKLLISLDKQNFKTMKRKNKPDKRLYMVDIDVPDIASTGWYRIDVKTNTGKVHSAEDYVVMTRLDKVTEMQPSGEDKEFSIPINLQWTPVPGAQFYQVFVRDAWTGKMVYQSKLINTNKIKIPDEKLVPGGYYSWAVHARDTNEHILLGDFHMGSISNKIFFNVSE